MGQFLIAGIAEAIKNISSKFFYLGNSGVDRINAFDSIRDISYQIPLAWGEEDKCCSGKHEKLLKILTKQGYKVRYRVCVFLWNSPRKLPLKLEKIPHDNDCTHTYLEVYLGGKWRVLDATWDKGLRKLFPINEWDGKSSTKLAVKSIKIFSPKKSLRIVKNQTKKIIEEDLKRNGKFYAAFNKFLEEKRLLD